MFSKETFSIAAAFNICKKKFNSIHKRNSQMFGNKVNRVNLKTEVTRKQSLLNVCFFVKFGMLCFPFISVLTFFLLLYCGRNIPEQNW